MATIAELTKMRADLFAARMNGTRAFQDQNGERVESNPTTKWPRQWRRWTLRSPRRAGQPPVADLPCAGRVASIAFWSP